MNSQNVCKIGGAIILSTTLICGFFTDLLFPTSQIFIGIGLIVSIYLLLFKKEKLLYKCNDLKIGIVIFGLSSLFTFFVAPRIMSNVSDIEIVAISSADIFMANILVLLVLFNQEHKEFSTKSWKELFNS